MSICGGSTLGKALYQVLCIQKFFDFLKVKLFTGKNSLHLVGNMKFLIVGDVEHLFTYMLAIRISCLEICLVKSFGRFKIRLHFYLYFFLLLICRHLGINPLQIYGLQLFPLIPKVAFSKYLGSGE